MNDVSRPEVPAQVVAFAQTLWELAAAQDFTGAVRELGEFLSGLIGSQWQAAESDVFAELGRMVSALGELVGHDYMITLLARHLFAERPQDAELALVEWLQLSEDESRVLGADSAATLMAHERVAQKRSETGDYAGAMALGEEVLAGRRQILGDDHVHTLGIKLSLAQWRGEGFDQAVAVSELEPLVGELREKLGEAHAHTLIARHTLALWGPQPDDVQEAVAIWEELVDAEARVLGEDYSATILARQELEKWRATAEEYRYVAEQIYKDEGLFGFDDVAEDEKAEAAEAADAVGRDDEAQAWAAAQSRAFPQWAAKFGGAQTWDFSTTSFEAVADLVFRETPTVEHLDDPANAVLTEGLTWYLGEILCRLEPGQWRWVCCDDHDSSLADRYGVAGTGPRDWPVMPRRKLNYLIESGNPLDLYDDGHYFIHSHPWPCGYFDNTDTGAWTWTGESWQSQRELWLESVAARIETLSTGVPDGIALDYSAESLRSVGRFVVDSSTDAFQDGVLEQAVACYVGESLLRAFGGRWLWDDREHSVTRESAVVRLFIDDYMGAISPTHLVRFAVKWGDPETFSRVYSAQRLRFFKKKEEDPSWSPMRDCTPGLDQMEKDEPTYWDSWRGKRQHDFPEFAARYGPDETWDFRRDSLLKLGEIVTELLDVHDDAAKRAKECAAWYFGEALYRARPSYWGYATNWRDPTGWIVDERPADPWGISLTTFSRVGFAGVFPVQDVDVRDYQRDYHHPGWLRDKYDRWVTGEMRQRLEDAAKRRRLIKRKASRRISGEKYVQRWLAERTEQFADWAREYGADGEWDFSPKSLEVLEDIVLQRGSTPEQLLDDDNNTGFVDGAVWYLGEVLRRARPIPWEYDRDDDAADPTVGHIDVLEVLTGVFTSVDRGSLRRRYDRLTARGSP